MAKEKIKFIDGSEEEFEIFSLGGRKAYMIVDEHVPLNGIKQHQNGDVSMEGNIKLFTMKLACLETIKGLDLDKIEAEEIGRIYDKYFAESINSVMRQGGANPN